MSNTPMTLDRKITWGTIMTAVALVVALTAWSGKVHADAELRISLLEQEMELVREMRQDIRAIRDVTVLLPAYMKSKDDEDERQWRAIENLASEG